MPASARSRLEDLVEMEFPVFSPLDNPSLGYDAINQIVASHIERRIPSASEIRRNSDLLNIAFNFQASILQSLDRTAFHRRHLGGRAFFNLNVCARSRAQVDGGPWRCHYEFDVVKTCQTRQTVRANFVCGVPVCSHPVCSDDYARYVLRFPFETEECSSH